MPHNNDYWKATKTRSYRENKYMTITDIAPVGLQLERTVTVPLIPRQPRASPITPVRPPPTKLPVSRTATLDAPEVPAALHLALPVTTLRQGARVAIDRTRRFTVMGHVPVVGVLVVPWLWPLHMAIVGLTADHIRLTPDASLSYSDGITPRRHLLISLMSLVAILGWLALAGAGVLMLRAADHHGTAIALATVLLL